MSIASDFIEEATKLFAPQQRKREWYEEMEEEVCSICPKMTYQQRIGGCLIFMVLGFLLSLGSLTRIIQLLAGNPTPFALMYSIGNIVSLCSTCFLYGPWTQAKKMFAPTRLVSTGIYLFFLGLTMFLAFYKHYIPARRLLLLMSICAQFMALSWYSISFIPYARDFVKQCCITTCCSCLKPQQQQPPQNFFSLL